MAGTSLVLFALWPARGGDAATSIPYPVSHVDSRSRQGLGFGEDALDRFSESLRQGDFPENARLQEKPKMSGIAAHHPRAEAMVRLNITSAALPVISVNTPAGMVISQHHSTKSSPTASMARSQRLPVGHRDCEIRQREDRFFGLA